MDAHRLQTVRGEAAMQQHALSKTCRPHPLGQTHQAAWNADGTTVRQQQQLPPGQVLTCCVPNVDAAVALLAVPVRFGVSKQCVQAAVHAPSSSRDGSYLCQVHVERMPLLTPPVRH
jgi:hypothetical protein